jgi:glucose-6-phosphate 1-dehydrogenase
MEEINVKPYIIVIFGSTGDLAWRKLIPALYNLYLDKWLPEKFSVVGIGRRDITDAEFRKNYHEGVDKFSRSGKADVKTWNAFAKNFSYLRGEFDDKALYDGIGTHIKEIEKEWGEEANHLFYMAVAPEFFEMISVKLHKSGLGKNKEADKIVVEKPFGHDLKSSIHLNQLLHSMYDEGQIFRIDHYLGKETVQNILAFRFANLLFEPLWNRNYIDHIQFTVSEQLGVENRGGYYETAGALRDMIQNHILQLLCLIAMEPPVSFEADEIRNRKVDVLNAVQRLKSDNIQDFAVRGQYGPGWIEGAKVKGYREEKDVAKDSNRETFAAVKLFIDNWRWQGVPFYLRTGKRMKESTSVITIQFKSVPHRSFPPKATGNWPPNRLTLNIQPRMGIKLSFQAKRPGLEMLLNPVEMDFDYNGTYSSGTPEAYETLLLDVMKGDSTLFMRGDQVEAAWAILMPVIDMWENNPAKFPNYAAGEQGPEDAEALIAKDGHNWI